MSTGIVTVRRATVAVAVLLLVAAAVTFDVPYRVWYRLGGEPGTSDLLFYTVAYRVTGDGDKTVTYGTPGGDLTESMYQDETREVESWDNGAIARISVQAGLTGGAVGCQILVNGVVEDTGSASGPQAVATCRARVRLNG